MTTPSLPYDFPLSPLEYLREKIGYDPYLFWGMSNSKVRTTSQCNTPVREYAWQNANQIGRSEMREAILNAESDILTEAHFSVAPRFCQEEAKYLNTNLLAQNNYYNASQLGLGNVFGQWTSVQLNQGYIQGIGYEDLTLLEDAEVVLSDENNDGLIDTFKLVVPTSETDPRNLAIYFAEPERLDEDGVSERWRIQPVKIRIEGGFANITGRSWLIVRPILYQSAVMEQPLDPDEESIYAPTLEVYTRKVNPSGILPTNSQITMLWETSPYPAWVCPPTDVLGYSTDPSVVGYAVGRAGIRNAKLGIVIPAQATYNADTEQWNENMPVWNWRPDRVLVRMYAGYPLEANGEMNKKMRDITLDLAIASMPERACACDTALRALEFLQWDMARIANGVQQYATTQKQLNNIFGTRRGQIRAWEKLKHLVLTMPVTT